MRTALLSRWIVTVPAQKPESCKTCPLYASDGIVWGEGPRDAKMLLVGEAPGEDEALSLRPYVGGSGRVLNAVLAHAGVDRKATFVTNVVKCRPTARGAGGRIVNRQPTETEIRCCAKFLLGELEVVRPNVVMALGNVPLHTLTNYTKGITTMRSVPLEGPKRRDGQADRYKVIGTLHPAALMRQQDYWPAIVFDVVRARTESSFPGIVRRSWKRTIHARLSDVGEALRRRITEQGHYHHDLETTGLDPRTDTIRCIGLAAEPDEVFCFDWTGDVIEFVRQLHADERLTTVGQNSEGFDIPFQEYKGFTFKGPSYDTMIGWHLLNSALPKDLGFIGATVTDEVYWKDEGMYKAGEDALQNGCCKDVHATGRAFVEQHVELAQLDQLDLYYNQIMPLQPVLRAMKRRGLRKDQRAAAAWHTVLPRKADELETKLRRGLGDASFDLNSPKQLMDLLYRRMGLPVQYNQDRERGLRPTVDSDALDNLALVTSNPIFKLIHSVRTLRKWDATFVLCPQDDNGIVHPSFGSAKAVTGRLNSFDPNIQNWPDDVREIIVPDDDEHILLSRDWSQIEWRIAMVLSGDRTGLEALAAGRDAHKDAYAQAFFKEYDAVTKNERFEAKTINYGLLYGRSNESVAAGRPGHPETAMQIDHVSMYVQKFFAKFAGYYSFREHIKDFVSKNHYFATAWKRRRWWYGRQQMPEAFNYPMQGNAAHMMYIALIELERQLPQGATLRASVHDEVLLNVHKSVAKQAIECTRDVMEQTFNLLVEHSRYPDIVRYYYPNGWFCPTDYHIGVNWRMCKSDRPEDVQREGELRRHLGISVVQ